MLTNSPSLCLSNPQIVARPVAGVGDPGRDQRSRLQVRGVEVGLTACRWRKRKLFYPDNLELTARDAEILAAIGAPFPLRFRYSVALKNRMHCPADPRRALRKRSGGERKRGTVDNRDRLRTAAPIRERRPRFSPRQFSLFAAPANAEQLPGRKRKQLHKWQPREEQSRVVDVSGRKFFRRAIAATSQFRQSESSRATMRMARAAASCNAAATRGSDRQLRAESRFPNSDHAPRRSFAMQHALARIGDPGLHGRHRFYRRRENSFQRATAQKKARVKSNPDCAEYLAPNRQN